VDPFDWVKLFASAMLGGLFALGVLVVGQGIIRFFFEPVLELRKTIGEVGFALQHYANVSPTAFSGDHHSDEERKEHLIRLREASESYREKGNRLYGQAYAILGYRWAVNLRLLPPWKNILDAQASLTGLSNNVFDRADDHWEVGSQLRQEITDALQLARDLDGSAPRTVARRRG
jgi:hypothetical protein